MKFDCVIVTGCYRYTSDTKKLLWLPVSVITEEQRDHKLLHLLQKKHYSSALVFYRIEIK